MKMILKSPAFHGLRELKFPSGWSKPVKVFKESYGRQAGIIRNNPVNKNRVRKTHESQLRGGYISSIPTPYGFYQIEEIHIQVFIHIGLEQHYSQNGTLNWNHQM
jgi:hypothetical protein